MADEKKFKYYAKIELGKKKTRYFYSKEEYLAYLNKKKNSEDKSKNKNSLSNLLKSITKSVGDKVNKAKKSVFSFISKGKKTVNKLLAKSIKSPKVASKTVKDFANKGKKAIDKIVNATSIKKAATSIKSSFSKLSQLGKKAADKVLNKSTKIVEKAVKKGESAVSKILSDIPKTEISVDGIKSSASDVKKSLSKLAKKGESAAKSAVEKMETKTLGASSALDTITKIADKVASWLKGGVFKVAIDAITDLVKNGDQKSSSGSFIEQAKEYYNEYAKDPDAWKKWKLEDLPKKKSKMSPEEDMAAVNPYYASGYMEYTYNCIFCTTAYDMRRRGYDVSAIPKVSEHTIDDAAKWYKPPAEVKEYRGTSDLEKQLLEEGEGASGNLALYWANGGGHSVYWEVKNGEVVIRDTQSNKVLKVEDYEGYLGKYGHYIRTDNLDLDRTAMETIVRNDKKKKE